MSKKKRSKFLTRIGLMAMFSLIVFCILVITAFIMAGFIFLSFQYGLPDRINHRGPFIPVFQLLVTSVIVGTLISPIMGKLFLKPINKIIVAINKLAEGDFSVRLNISNPPEAVELSQSFNRMAGELGNIELLRNDFVNNFSHEFKTPIVSIKGFAEMLKYEDLTVNERNEYLDIVISESSRLASLATNVLNLSKIESQTILTDQCQYNVGEQIRKNVILLQARWEAKNLEVTVEGEDIDIIGNEELLNQVWLNLLDNAVKFSPDGERISLSFYKKNHTLHVIIQNSGTTISTETFRHIFDKFYQGDTSHAVSGNGLGLTLVKKIVELHNGKIFCESKENSTKFTVLLPIS